MMNLGFYQQKTWLSKDVVFWLGDQVHQLFASNCCVCGFVMLRAQCSTVAVLQIFFGGEGECTGKENLEALGKTLYFIRR